MEGWRERLWYRFNFWTLYPAFTLGFSYRSEGSRYVPPNGPLLILANHESFLDPPLIGLAVRRKIHYLARKTLFRNPAFGAYLRSMGTVPVDQEGVAKEGLRTSIDLLQADKALLIFPEGERSPEGHMLPFKPGIHLVLRKVPVPILPVGIAGAFESYPRHALLPRLCPFFLPANGAAVAVSVGKVIPPAHYRAMEREELLTFLFDEVQAQVRRAEKILRKMQ